MIPAQQPAANDAVIAHSQESAWLGHGIEKAVCLLVAHEAARLARGEITQQSFQITCQRARGEISAFFKDITVERIDRALVERFVTYLSAKQIRASTIKAYLVVLRKLLTRCLHQEWIDRVPAFPTVKAPNNPRGHFTVVEYLRLLRAAKQLRSGYTEPPTRGASHRSTRGGIFTATQGVPWEMAWLIGFMVNSFVRPSGSWTATLERSWTTRG